MFSGKKKAKFVLWYQQFNKSVATVQRQYRNFYIVNPNNDPSRQLHARQPKGKCVVCTYP
jgi:hypothetical protein